MNEIAKCLLCKNPQCQGGCPIATPIRDVIGLMRDNKTDEAGALLFANNPLTAFCGELCPGFCRKSCVLSKAGRAVDFSIVEKQVSVQYLDKIASRQNPSAKQANPAKQSKVLVVGSGPAGLAAAYFLCKNGFRVEVRERSPQLGGMLRYGIPDFRFDKTTIDKLAAVLTNMGITFKTNSPVSVANILEVRQKEGYDAVFLASGAGISKNLGIDGENLPHVIGALDFLKNRHVQNGKSSVVVIGGGNVAMDCASLAAASGCDTNLCYRRGRENLRAWPHETDRARDFGAKFNFHHTPKRITAGGVYFDVDGREVFFPCDLVVAAIGQSVENLPNAELAAQNGIYIIGDAAAGATTTIAQAVANAKKAVNAAF